MVKQILIGIVVAAMGGGLIAFSAQIADLFGRNAWFERNLGGTRSGYVLIGFGVVLIGFLIMFGVIPTDSGAEVMGP